MNQTQIIIRFTIGSKEQSKYLRGYLLLKGHGFTATHTTDYENSAVIITLTAPQKAEVK